MPHSSDGSQVRISKSISVSTRSHTQRIFVCKAKRPFTSLLTRTHVPRIVELSPRWAGRMSHYRWNRRFYDHIDDPYDSIYMGEPALARRRRLRAEEKEGKQAKVIERAGSDKSLERAAKRLKHVQAEDRVLYVPQWDMAKA